MIRKLSETSAIGEEVARLMQGELEEAKNIISFSSLTETLVKCAEVLEENEDSLVSDVDDVLAFLDKDIL